MKDKQQCSLDAATIAAGAIIAGAAAVRKPDPLTDPAGSGQLAKAVRKLAAQIQTGDANAGE